VSTHTEFPDYRYDAVRNDLLEIKFNPIRRQHFLEDIHFAVKWTIGDRPGFFPRDWDECVREEKSVLGIAVAREMCRRGVWKSGVHREFVDDDTNTNTPDAIVRDVPVEIKVSARKWFGVRKKQIGHLATLFDICPVYGDIRVGLLVIKPEHLNDSVNDASKQGLSTDCLNSEVEWIVHENFRGLEYRLPGQRAKDALAAQKPAAAPKKTTERKRRKKISADSDTQIIATENVCLPITPEVTVTA
jgi:hypothetical protein